MVNAEAVYSCFHDEEWGVPVHDDVKLLELLVFSQALAELSWPLILSKRAAFRYYSITFGFQLLNSTTPFLTSLWIAFQKGFQ